LKVSFVSTLIWFKNWQSNNLQRGCTNLQCQGFVQTDNSIILGQSFNQTSTIDGLTVELPLAILQVLFKLYHFHNKNVMIIYFIRYYISLFNFLTTHNLNKYEEIFFP